MGSNSYTTGEWCAVDVTVLGLVGGAPGAETPRVADSSAPALPGKLSASGRKTLGHPYAVPAPHTCGQVAGLL